MMRQRALVRVGVTSVAALCGAWFGCGGGEPPVLNAEFAGVVASNYDPAQAGAAAVGSAGSTGMGSEGGDGGAAGAGMSEAGSGGESGGAAGLMPGGAAGSSMVAAVGESGLPEGGSGGAAGSGSMEERCDGFAVLEEHCSSSGCHGEGSNLGNFAESEAAAREYIGAMGTVCAGQGSIIDTDDPGASLLVRKLSDEPPCAQPMPLNAEPLPQEDIDCIEDWIGGL